MFNIAKGSWIFKDFLKLQAKKSLIIYNYTYGVESNQRFRRYEVIFHYAHNSEFSYYKRLTISFSEIGPIDLNSISV